MKILTSHQHRLLRHFSFRNRQYYSFSSIKQQRCFAATTTTHTSVSITTELDGFPLDAPDCNVTPHIAQKVGAQLHRQRFHPLGILQQRIVDYYCSRQKDDDDDNDSFDVFDTLSPIVTTHQNFDVLRIPPTHVSRSKSDTYYLNKTTCLRTHTSAHQVELLQQGLDRFLISGEVFRRDEIDASHYPVFYQMEGVKMFNNDDDQATSVDDIEADLKQNLQGLAQHLFGSDIEMRWVDAYFPFTEPSFELEIFYNDDWLEVLGCGVIHQDILKAAGRTKDKGWAFGLGLERLAMVLFQIPDIRLFWSQDERFHKQFSKAGDIDGGGVVVFEPYSKYPPCYKDVSFWLSDTFHVNDLYELVRHVGGDLVEQVQLMDDFVHPQTQRTSHCYRISYRSMDRSLTNQEIDALQEQVRQLTVERLGVELR